MVTRAIAAACFFLMRNLASEGAVITPDSGGISQKPSMSLSACFPRFRPAFRAMLLMLRVQVVVSLKAAIIGGGLGGRVMANQNQNRSFGLLDLTSWTETMSSSYTG